MGSEFVTANVDSHEDVASCHAFVFLFAVRSWQLDKDSDKKQMGS
jgi:hypothetical protein